MESTASPAGGEDLAERTRRDPAPVHEAAAGVRVKPNYLLKL